MYYLKLKMLIWWMEHFRNWRGLRREKRELLGGKVKENNRVRWGKNCTNMGNPKKFHTTPPKNLLHSVQCFALKWGDSSQSCWPKKTFLVDLGSCSNKFSISSYGSRLSCQKFAIKSAHYRKKRSCTIDKSKQNPALTKSSNLIRLPSWRKNQWARAIGGSCGGHQVSCSLCFFIHHHWSHPRKQLSLLRRSW